MDLSPLSLGLLIVLCLGQRSSAYIEKILENDSVCSLRFSPSSLTLIGREEQSAMVVRGSRYFQNWTGKQEFNCQFTVSSSLNWGVFAVIQRMSFRRNSQGQCIDFVQFRQVEKPISLGSINLKIKSSESWSAKMCGKVNAFEIDVDNEVNQNSGKDEDTAINSFIAQKGLVEVKIHLANKSLEHNEELSFEIVFTAFQDCKFDNGLWKHCGGRTCIYKDFFQDGKFNCPFKNCKDEDGCHPVVSVLNDNGYHFNTTFGTKIMAGTVAGLLTMFIAFIALIWLLRHCGSVFCCIGNPNSHPHSSEMQPVPNLDSMAIMATAPPDSSCADVRSADKDLPPSYDSLFPSK